MGLMESRWEGKRLLEVAMGRLVLEHRKGSKKSNNRGSFATQVTVISAAASLQGGCGFNSGPGTFLCGFSSGSLASSHSAKNLHVRSTGSEWSANGWMDVLQPGNTV